MATGAQPANSEARSTRPSSAANPARGGARSTVHPSEPLTRGQPAETLRRELPVAARVKYRAHIRRHVNRVIRASFDVAPPLSSVRRRNVNHRATAPCGSAESRRAPTKAIAAIATHVKIQVDGIGGGGCSAWRDAVFVERLWRGVRYEGVYLRAYAGVSDACAAFGRHLDCCSCRRPHWRLGAKFAGCWQDRGDPTWWGGLASPAMMRLRAAIQRTGPCHPARCQAATSALMRRPPR